MSATQHSTRSDRQGDGPVVLVTGASGLVGQALLGRLDGHVIAVTSPTGRRSPSPGSSRCAET